MVVEIDLGIDEESSARLAPGDQKGLRSDARNPL
jgi:hypothetical protein